MGKINKKQRSFNIWTSSWEALNRLHALTYLKTEKVISKSELVHVLITDALNKIEKDIL